MGTLERREIEIDGVMTPLDGFRLPSTFSIGFMNFVSNSLVFNFLHRSRLRVDPEECTACGECLEACPSGAMVESDGPPVVDSRTCHQCFCCYELCPTGAVKVRGALGALLRGRNKR
jgi:NAD-dependent dihydropyrimidine dehydrogenase PreA subunit